MSSIKFSVLFFCLCLDLKKVPAFDVLHLEHSDASQCLHLIFRPSRLLTANSPAYKRSYLVALKRIIDTFFDTRLGNILDDDEDDSNDDGIDNHIANGVQNTDAAESDEQHVEPTKVSIDQLYQELRTAHVEYDNLAVNACDIQHPDLKPRLTDYQVDAVRWMLERELRDDFFPTEFVEIPRRWPVKKDGYKFFYNERTTELSLRKGRDIQLPSGGILAEEMGLGKTVETLTLILLNQRKPAQNNDDLEEPPAKKFKLNVARDTSAGLKCLCTKRANRKMIQCTKCSRFQHKKCVFKHSTSANPEENYICPECWLFEPQIPSAGTFIVSPASIKMQWYAEIQKHISNERLKVLVYDGIQNSGWISPADLASYDIVLTDYTAMQRELNFAPENKVDRNLRRAPRRINPVSPLYFVQWWRVCLDEAQMAESINSKCAMMVRQLPARHRWAVTGTPVQRSINDLYGLLYFLDCFPYTDECKWFELMREFTTNSNAAPMIEVLKKIMWRTCKTDQILRQIKIPSQTEIMHYIESSDLEKFFYGEEHALCFGAFKEKVRRIDRNMVMSTMTPHILKLVSVKSVTCF